jgi:glycosyltransferase involved in cell wall biosynthesis
MPRRAASSTVAVGPALPGSGSWDHVGTELVRIMTPPGTWKAFAAWEEPAAATFVIIKHVPPAAWIDRIARRAAVLYCPFDYYGSLADVAADAAALRRCTRILVHDAALRPVFESYAPVEILECPIHTVGPLRRRFVGEGIILWAGARPDLAPLVDWVNAHPLPNELVVLSQFDDRDPLPASVDFGFLPGRAVRLERWTKDRQVELMTACRAALDITGSGWRAGYAQTINALEMLASGIPLAVNPENSLVANLAARGLDVASPLDLERWLSPIYWQECRRIGRELRQRSTIPKMAARCRSLVKAVLQERSVQDASGSSLTPVAGPAVATLVSKVSKDSASDSAANVPKTAYEEAKELALGGQYAEAERLYDVLTVTEDRRTAALVLNDRAALRAVEGDWAAARKAFAAAIQLDSDCAPARLNLAVLDASDGGGLPVPRGMIPAHGKIAGAIAAGPPPPGKVAVVSFLFNWPSTGGGIVHTVELCRFLSEGGYDVRHIYCRFDPWEIGRVEAAVSVPTECLHFAANEWDLQSILGRFRRAVDGFAPDYVIVTDSWNIKPLLADAFRGHRVILRLQAMECLCPLNNVRLLPGPGGCAAQCPKHQLATPDECRRCLDEFGATSGGLHQAERRLCGVGTSAYDAILRRAFREAEAVLVVNPLTEALVSPYARAVKVVTAGMDPARFPWPWAADPAEPLDGRPVRLLFAGLVGEWMKGFHILHDACERLWKSQRDFELLATADPPGRLDDFTRNVGWLTQADLPRQIRAADILVMPTIAQEGLGRTAVEAMGCGRPVVASRIGGLMTTILDGATGLLFEPGDAADLAHKLSMLIADPDLRRRLGEAGRRRFEESYTWPVIIDRHYRPLFRPPSGGVAFGATTAARRDYPKSRL